MKSVWIERHGTIGKQEEEVYDWRFSTLGDMADAVEKGWIGVGEVEVKIGPVMRRGVKDILRWWKKKYIYMLVLTLKLLIIVLPRSPQQAHIA